MTRLSGRITHHSSLVTRRFATAGFVDPIYMILVAVATTGLALAFPALQALIEGAAATAWDWAGLGAGITLIAACGVYYARLQ